MDDFLVRLSARTGAYSFLDVPAKMEVLALASFCCCLLGSMSSAFPLAQNIGIALLALLACRGNSEAQLAAACAFSLFTTVTDIIIMFANPSGWGGAMTTLNLLLKLAIAAHAYRMCETLGALADEIPSSVEGGCGSGAAGSTSGGYPVAYHAPALKDDDADDAGARQGEATRYRAI